MVAATLAWRELSLGRLRVLLNAIVAVGFLIALFGIGAFLATGDTDALLPANALLAALGLLTLVTAVALPERLARGYIVLPHRGVLAAGTLAFAIEALYTNLARSFGYPSSRLLDSLGFAVLLFSFGYVALRMVVDRERRLLSIENELAGARHLQLSILPTAMPDLAGVTKFAGWQVHPQGRTVQGVLGDVLRRVTGQNGLVLRGAGRTDAGVHALAQVVSLECREPLAVDRLLADLERTLPADLAVRELRPLQGRFHPRHDAVLRSYRYQIARRRSAFGKRCTWWVREPIDTRAMAATAARMVGRMTSPPCRAGTPGRRARSSSSSSAWWSTSTSWCWCGWWQATSSGARFGGWSVRWWQWGGARPARTTWRDGCPAPSYRPTTPRPRGACSWRGSCTGASRRSCRRWCRSACRGSRARRVQVAIDKGWFKEAVVDVKFEWFDYSASMEAFSAGKIDAVTMTNGDALVTGAAGGKSAKIMLTDYSNGNDMIVAKPGIKSLKDLKGKKVAVEEGLVEHLLLLNGLKKAGMKESDVKLVNAKTNEMPQVLAAGDVSAIGAWQPVAGQAMKAVPGSRPIYTSADEPGLIYDVLAVNPASAKQRRADWMKVVKVWDKVVAYINDPKTQPDAVKIMAAKSGVSPEVYLPLLKGKRCATAPMPCPTRRC